MTHPGESKPITIRDALREGIATLMGHSNAPRLDAHLILAHVLERSREYLIAHDEDTLMPLQRSIFEKLIALRTHGMPVAYILGSRPFYDRTLKVSAHVLIPRPESEHVVEEARAYVQQRLNGKAVIIDVGTGSGAIAVTLAAHLPESTVYATDISAQALLTAKENGAELTNYYIAQSDLLSSLRGPFDVICANMPYIATEELDLLEVAKFEPIVALDGGRDGLKLIRRLLDQVPGKLRNPGLVLLEHGADQGPAVMALAKAAFPQAQVTQIKDLAKLDRVVRVEVG